MVADNEFLDFLRAIIRRLDTLAPVEEHTIMVGVNRLGDGSVGVIAVAATYAIFWIIRH